MTRKALVGLRGFGVGVQPSERLFFQPNRPGVRALTHRDVGNAKGLLGAILAYG